MIVSDSSLEYTVIQVIKEDRYKTVKTNHSQSPCSLFTKVMKIQQERPFEQFESQLLNRIGTLKTKHRTTLFMIRQKNLLRADLIDQQKRKIVYLSNTFMHGWSLNNIILNRQLKTLFNSEDLTKIVWHVFKLLLITDTGFNNVIVTNDNLFFEDIGQKKFQPRVNYLSFVGFNFLKAGTPLSKEEYLEIAAFLDDEALETGNIDRFGFKARTLACLVLSLACQKNIQDFIFRNQPLDISITKEKATVLHKEVVTSRIKTILSFPSTKHKVDELGIKGLFDFILSAFNYSEQEILWDNLQTYVLRQKYDQNSVFTKLANIFWEAQGNQLKSALTAIGGNIKSIPQIYLIMKCGFDIDFMFQTLRWSDNFHSNQSKPTFNKRPQSFTGQTVYANGLFYKLLRQFMSLPQDIINKNLQIMQQIRRILFSGTEKLGYKIDKQNKIENQSIKLMTFERQLLYQYDFG